jgi:hypothetical protein
LNTGVLATRNRLTADAAIIVRAHV